MSPDGFTKPPPEEKLLRLIRGKGPRPDGGAERSPAPSRGMAARDTVGSALSVRAQGPDWPQLAVTGFGLLLIIEVMVLGVQLLRPLPALRVPEVIAPSSDEPPVAALPLEGLPSLAAGVSRPLFTAPVESSPSPGTPTAGPRSGPSAAAKMLASRLSLMGIVAGDPAQAIIEDSQTRKTYFVTTGQAVVEGAVLEQVLDNRVILDLDGEKIELTL